MIYVASSWRNNIQPSVVERLRLEGYDVYDFRHPVSGDDGFHWSEIDPAWESWTSQQFTEALNHQQAERGFKYDFEALARADVVLLVMPCGRSAHLELGWAVGAGKKTIILLASGEPELMYKMVDYLATSIDDVVAYLAAE